MTHRFDEQVVSAVLHHMNTDHAEDNALIVRAFGEPTARRAEMLGLDGSGGDWRATLRDGTERWVRIPWPAGEITERSEVRREVVAIYDEACRRFGLDPRPHD